MIGFLVALYILVVLVANYTAAVFIPIAPFGLVALGTLFFGATFTIRDYVHGAGRRVVYAMIGAAAIANVVMSFALDVPLRIIAASFLSILIAETTDTEIYHKLRLRSWIVRVISSNLISAPIDSILFTFIAFYGDLSLYDIILPVIVGDTVTKYAIGLIVALPRIVRRERIASAQ